ncbi:MAG: hypothetical protein IKC91_00530 [Clostridia bacterium]|nr:hypothetical protein [Clostridia bacterium]
MIQLKKIKKLLTIGLALLFMLCMSVSFLGCKQLINQRTLQRIPKEGNYIFLNTSAGITNGNDYIDIEAEVLKVIRKEKKLLFTNGGDLYYILSDDGRSMQFIVCYERKHNENDYWQGEYKFAIGSTSLPYLDIKINCYLPTQNDASFKVFNSQGNYFFCQDEENFYAINRTTYEMTSIPGVHQYSFSTFSSGGGGFLLYNRTDDGMLVRIFDEHLIEYEVLLENNWRNWKLDFRGDYLFYCVVGNEQEQCICVNYKTGEQLNQEQSYALYQTYFAAETIMPVQNLFEYNGKRYTWESVSDSTQTSTAPTELSIQDLDTGEEYRLVPDNLTGNGAKVLRQVSEIFVGLNWKSVFVNNGELFFVLVNEDSFFGIGTSKTSPQIVFKYNETTKELVYVGYSMPTYYPLHWIYNADSLQ